MQRRRMYKEARIFQKILQPAWRLLRLNLEKFLKNGIEVGLWTGTAAEIVLMVQLYVFEGRAFELRFDTTLHLIESGMAFIVFYFLSMAILYSIVKRAYMKDKIVHHAKKNKSMLVRFFTFGAKI